MSVKPIEGSTTSTRASPVQYTKRVPEKESVKIEVTTPEKFKYVEPINSAGIKIHSCNHSPLLFESNQLCYKYNVYDNP